MRPIENLFQYIRVIEEFKHIQLDSWKNYCKEPLYPEADVFFYEDIVRINFVFMEFRGREDD